MPFSIVAPLHACGSRPLLQINKALGTLRTLFTTGDVFSGIGEAVKYVAFRGLKVTNASCIQEMRRHQSEYKLIPDCIYWKLNRPILFDIWYIKLCLCSGTNHLKACKAPGCWIYVFLTFALNWGEWHLHAPSHFTPDRRSPIIHYVGGCVGPNMPPARNETRVMQAMTLLAEVSWFIILSS